MTEKRFRVNDLVKYNYSEIGEYIDGNHTDRPLRNDEVVELLNELHEENQSFEIHSKWQGEKYSELLDSFTNMKKKFQLVKKENEQLKSFIKKLTNHNGEILLMNGYGYTKSYVERLLE